MLLTDDISPEPGFTKFFSLAVLVVIYITNNRLRPNSIPKYFEAAPSACWIARETTTYCKECSPTTLQAMNSVR
jgi:hypothetical protein